MSIDLTTLWDFQDPALSEQRFRAALERAQGDDRLVLQTQIARSHGLRGDFATARTILASIEPQLENAGAEVRARHALEVGRTFASATHPAGARAASETDLARAAFMRAWQVASAAHLDALAIDAIHMLAFVDTAPEDQLRWGLEALAVIAASTQPAALRWEASVRNNVGCALHQLKRFEEALVQFERAVALREQGTNADATRVAHWMVGWTLRALERNAEALEVQLRLEQACEAAGRPDPHVFAELEILYRQMGDTTRAQYYAQRKESHPR